MRRFLVLLVLVGWVLPVSAAQTFKVPLTVVPGSVILTPPGGPAAPATLPLSQFGSEPGCSGTFTAEIVDGGLEVELDGAASDCTLQFKLIFDAQFVAPEVGGSGTVIRLEGVAVESEFAAIAGVLARWLPTGDGRTSSPPNRRFDCSNLRADYALTPGGPDTGGGQPLVLTATIPGDTVTCQVELQFEFNAGGPGGVTNGTLRMRYESLVTVPEPSASLMLPMGMAWLAGLSMLRGGA